MCIKINLYPFFHQYANGQQVVEVSGNTVGQCLDGLVRQFPGIETGLFGKNGKLLNYVEIYVNLESSYPEELVKPVRDGDELHTVLIIAGG